MGPGGVSDLGSPVSFQQLRVGDSPIMQTKPQISRSVYALGTLRG